jgi:hypothetical protein
VTGQVRRSPDLAWVESEDRVVLVRLDDLAAEPLVLSGSAAAIWAAADEPGTVEALVERVAAAYDSPADVVRDEVAAFVGTCVGLGILRVGDSD